MSGHTVSRRTAVPLFYHLAELVHRHTSAPHFNQRSHDGLTNLLFPFEDGVDIDFGRLAVWRLATHEQFGGTWLSDYIPNRLEDLETDESQDSCQQCEM